MKRIVIAIGIVGRICQGVKGGRNADDADIATSHLATVEIDDHCVIIVQGQAQWRHRDGFIGGGVESQPGVERRRIAEGGVIKVGAQRVVRRVVALDANRTGPHRPLAVVEEPRRPQHDRLFVDEL